MSVHFKVVMSLNSRPHFLSTFTNCNLVLHCTWYNTYWDYASMLTSTVAKEKSNRRSKTIQSKLRTPPLTFYFWQTWSVFTFMCIVHLGRTFSVTYDLGIGYEVFKHLGPDSWKLGFAHSLVLHYDT